MARDREVTSSTTWGVLGGALSKKIIELSGGQINDTLSSRYCSHSFRPATSSTKSQTLDVHFELKYHTSRVITPASCVAPRIIDIHVLYQRCQMSRIVFSTFFRQACQVACRNFELDKKFS